MKLLLAGFAFLAVVTSAQYYLAARLSGEVQRVELVLLFGAASWGLWGIAAPGIVWLGRRFDFSRGRRLVSFTTHVVAATACYVVSTVLVVWMGVSLFNPTEALTWRMMWGALVGSSRLSLSLITYAVILALDRSLRLWQAAAERETRAARSEAQASHAHLHALAARLHPHFLFNALQSASSLIDEDPARARTMIAQIGDLLRDVLSVPDDGDVTLRDEIALLQRYLAIEEIRFADRVRVRFALGPDTEAVRVPRLVLQPLAENALRHGLGPLPEGGTLRVSASRVGDRVQITVHNDGVPLPARVVDGVGLTMTRERLAARYGSDATLELRAAAPGTVALLELPA